MASSRTDPEYRLLGPLEVARPGGAVPLGGRRQRLVLAALLLDANRVVSVDRLIDALWGDSPPRRAKGTVQTYVYNLRQALGGNGSGPLGRTGDGYVLTAEPGAIDAQRFELRLADGRDALARGDPRDAEERFADALALWRGPALADFVYEPFAQVEIARLDELRLLCREERLEAALSAGRHADVIAELEALVFGYPLRERLRAQLMVALYRSGRQAEALDVYRDTRAVLDEELGIEPSPALRELERAILNQEDALLPAAPTVRVAVPAQLAPARKLVTVLSAELRLAAVSGEALDPEVAASPRRELVDAVASVVERFGGSAEQVVGGRAAAVFGIPAFREDDAVRAAQAALAAVELVSARAGDLGTRGLRAELRVALGSGEVFVDAGQPGLEAAWELAEAGSQLARGAEAGEIVLDELTLRLAAGALEFEGDRLRGVVSGGAPIARQLEQPLVGRTEELERLHKSFRAAVADRRPRLAVVAGTPGIGKSRLATELAAGLAGEAAVLSGRCLSYGDAITYWPLRELVAQAAGGETPAELEALLAGEDDAALVADRLATAIGASDTASSTEDILWAARRLVETLARRRPLVLVVDDVHWAEEALLDLLQHVVDRATDAPALVVALARPDVFETRPAWEDGALALEPLAEPEAEELLAGLTAGAVLSQETLERVREAAEGNPLFLEQLAAHVLELGGLPEETSLPPTIQALLTARLERLGPGERAVVEAASVIGRDFWDGAVRALLPSEARASVLRHLDALAGKQLLRPQRSSLAGEEAFSFGHVLIQAVAYRTVPKARRAELHEGFADWLERKEGAFESELDEILGYHLEQAWRYGDELGAGMTRRQLALGERASTHLSNAGRRAFARQDLAAAMSALQRAAALLAKGARDRPALLSDLGSVFVMAGRFESAKATLDEARAEAEAVGNERGQAHAVLGGLMLRMWIDPDGWVDELESQQEAVRRTLVRYQDDAGLGRLSRLAGIRLWLDGQAAAAAAAWEAAIAHADEAGDFRERFECYRWLVSAALFGPMPVVDAIPYCERILDQLGATPACAPPVLGPLAVLEAMRDRPDIARGHLTRAKADAHETGADAGLVSGLWWEAMVETLAGEVGAAEDLLRRELQRLMQLGEHAWLPGSAIDLASVLCDQGRYREAGPLCDLAEQHAGSSDLFAKTALWRTKARILVQQGRRERAEALARRAVKLADQTDLLVERAEARASLFLALKALGRTDEAHDVAAEAIGLSESKGSVATWRRLRRLFDHRE